MDSVQVGDLLALVNATLNATSAVALFPIWAYVSVTGLVVYVPLYRVYGYQ